MKKLKNDLYQFTKFLKGKKEFNKKGFNAYENIASLQLFSTRKYVEAGLYKHETKFYSHFESIPGKALVVGCSSGRECVYLAKNGWSVTGVDFVNDMINIARKFAKEYNLTIDYRTFDIKEIDEGTFDGNTFDFIAFTIYPLIPTQKQRLRILGLLRERLSPKGNILVNYHGRRTHFRISNPTVKTILKIIKPSYEDGDFIANGNFRHFFTEEQLREEVLKSGFSIKDVEHGDIYKCALLEKA